MATIDQFESGADQRAYWLKLLCTVVDPVLNALAQRRLRATMPVETGAGGSILAPSPSSPRAACAHLEAVARSLMGVAPWLEAASADPAEDELRLAYAELAREGIDAATDPDSPDLMNFGSPKPSLREPERNQALVDTAFLAQAMLRAPVQLWGLLPRPVQSNVLSALKESRQIVPGPSNWLLFSAVVEAAIQMAGDEPDLARMEHALREHESWYVGDGTYGDGPQFHWDYYNSYVIQPMILDILRVVDPAVSEKFGVSTADAMSRAQRYASVLERLISPEGTIPPIGRSLTYRIAALQTLAQLSLFDKLPAVLHAAQVRCAMTAVIRGLMDAPGTFDDHGWLRIGFCGHQPGLAESYISTGSLYLCCAAMLPLGLPSAHRFWNDPFVPWTSLRIYHRADAALDRALA